MEKILFFFLAFPSLVLGASTKYQSIEENETHSTGLHSLANCNSKDRPFYADLCTFFYKLHRSGLDLYQLCKIIEVYFKLEFAQLLEQSS